MKFFVNATAKDEIITYFKLRFVSHVPKSNQFVNKFYDDFQSLHLLSLTIAKHCITNKDMDIRHMSNLMLFRTVALRVI